MGKKLKDYFGNPTIQTLSDTRVLGLIGFGVIALLVTWSGVKSVQNNYALQKQINELNQQNSVKQLENTNLKLGNEYLKTDQYIELSARQKFGKAAPGETVYIVPKNVAIANTVEIKKKQEAKEVKEEQKPSYQKNLESWMDFFFGNKSNN